MLRTPSPLRPTRSGCNDINWCMANTSQGYHCTVAALVGIAE
ncbi:methylamine dehydrogenase light chain [Inquilinus sp.]